ncbi:MAG: glycine oxidase ThiO [Pseudomonadota bacterium]
MTAIQVIGAGVAGLAIAAELAERGAPVRLTDREPEPGAHACSWWAGGMLAPHCEGESAEEPVVRLGQEAADWWRAKGVDVTRKGSLVLTLDRDAGELRRFARRTSGYTEVTGQEIAALEPDLAGKHRAGLHFATEAHLAPRDALAALHAGLAAKGVAAAPAGAAVETTAEAPAETTAETIIDCRGLAAADALSDLRGVKGEMLVLRCPDITLTRPVRLLHPRIPLYIVPRGDGVYMLGATMIETAERGRITARSLLELLSAAYALHPAFAEAEVLEIGVDARPAFPDNLPRIRRRGTVIYANGLFRHGFLLAPAMARMVADLVLDGKIPEVMDEDHP